MDEIWFNDAVNDGANDVFKEGELDKKSNMQKMHIANSDKPVGISPKRIMAVREKKKIGANKG